MNAYSKSFSSWFKLYVMHLLYWRFNTVIMPYCFYCYAGRKLYSQAGAIFEHVVNC